MPRLFSKYYRKFLWGIVCLSTVLFIISIIQITRGNITGFEPLVYGFGFLLYGAFNWADVSVFTLLWIIIALMLFRIRQKEYFFVAYFSFWLIRSSGEVLFSFLQQFSPHYQPWLLYAPRALMQNTYLGHFILVRYWVVEQIFFQSIAVLALFGLMYIIIKILKGKG